MSNVALVVLIILVLLLIGVFPVWPHAQAWGYYPTGIFAFILVVALILVILKKL